MLEEYFELGERITILFFVGVPVFLLLLVLVVVSLNNSIRKLIRTLTDFSAAMMLHGSKDTTKGAPAYNGIAADDGIWKCIYCGVMNSKNNRVCISCARPHGRREAAYSQGIFPDASPMQAEGEYKDNSAYRRKET